MISASSFHTRALTHPKTDSVPDKNHRLSMDVSLECVAYVLSLSLSASLLSIFNSPLVIREVYDSREVFEITITQYINTYYT